MINLFFSCDERLLLQSKVMIFSLCSKTDENVTVHYFNIKLSEQKLKELELFVNKKCSAQLKVYNIDWHTFKDLPADDRIPYEAYSRLIAQFVLPEDVDRALWLDGDVVVLKDISEFYHQDFEGCPYVVCADIWDGTNGGDEIKEKLGISKEAHWFNSGVMLMNLEKLRKETDMADILERCSKVRNNMTFHDQDLLNHIYADQIKLNDWKKYNCQRLGNPKSLKIDYDHEVVILHYSGIRKPWDYKFLDGIAKYWWREYIKIGGPTGILKTVAFYIKGSLFKTVEAIIKAMPGNLYDKIKKLIWKV